jgi:uncharacterized protein
MNPIAYFEFAGPDSAALAAFYSTLFGWRFGPGPFPGYQSLPADGGAGLPGGVRQEGTPECMVYVRVPDLKAAVAAAEAAGGTVVVPPTEVPGVVSFALLKDPAGNRFGIVL